MVLVVPKKLVWLLLIFFFRLHKLSLGSAIPYSSVNKAVLNAFVLVSTALRTDSIFKDNAEMHSS